MAVCLLFLILTTLAMLLYPGGTHVDHRTEGYLFFQNFFSDLGLTQTYAGGPKTASYLLFTIALGLAGGALAIYFTIAPSLFNTSRTTKNLSRIGSVFGFISGLAFIGVALTPANLYNTPHKLLVQLAFVTFFIGTLFYAIAIFLSDAIPNRYAWVNTAFAILLGIYIWLIFFGPGIQTPNGLVIQVTGQKIIANAAIVCMFIQALGARRVLAYRFQKNKQAEVGLQVSVTS